MRKLASIQTIDNLTPIGGADKIECAQILGWKVIVRKDEHKVGDKIIYVEVDSLLPNLPEFEFLAKVKYRIKTIRMKGQISQGICFPLSILKNKAEYEVGEEVTEELGITKYEPPDEHSHGGPNRAKTRGNFPAEIPKTDETRIQSVPKLLEELNGVEHYVSVKIDGTSSTFVNLNGEIHACSRTRSVKDEDDNIYWWIARKYGIIDALKDAGPFTVQGEIAGYWNPNGTSPIQKNPLKLTETELFVFNVFKWDEQRYLNFDDFISFCRRYRLPTVPIINDSFMLNHTIDELLEMAKGTYPSGNIREGLVYRPKVERYSQVLKGRASFKVINNDYLLRGQT